MIELPVMGSALEAIGTILEKKVLRSRFMNFKNYTVYEFFSIVFVMLFFVGVFWGLKREAFLPKNLLIFVFVIIIATVANLLIFYSLKRENVSEFEPNWLMQPVFVIMMAFFIYPAERNFGVFILGLIASISLVASHIKKQHLIFDKYIIAALFGSFFFALELVISKPLLDFYSPFTFYFLRCFFIFAITFFIFRPHFEEIPKKSWIMMLAIGATWAIYRIIMYTGYQSLGIIYTSLLFALSPVFLYSFALIFLKEKPTWRQLTSSIIIVLCVIGAILIQNKVI